MKVICDLCVYRKVNIFDYGGVVFWRYVYSSRGSIRLMIWDRVGLVSWVMWFMGFVFNFFCIYIYRVFFEILIFIICGVFFIDNINKY